jgi:hypothetical protein
MQDSESDGSSMKEESQGILILNRLIKLPSHRSWVEFELSQETILQDTNCEAFYRFAELELVAGSSAR